MHAKNLACALGIVLWSVVAAELPPLWNNAEQSIKMANISATGTARMENGVLVAEGKSEDSTYHYLVACLRTPQPVSLIGKRIHLDIEVEDPQQMDSIYVKLLSAHSKVVASFYTKNVTGEKQSLTMTPGKSTGGVKWFAKDIRELEDTPITRVNIYMGRQKQNCKMKFRAWNLRLEERPPDPPVKTKDLGIGIHSAELRFCIAALDQQGHHLAVVAPEDSGDGYLLLTDLDTGKTTQHYIEPRRRGSIFGGGMTDGGKLVFGYSSRIYIFDINTRSFHEAGPTGSANLCACVAPDQKNVYLGSFPNATLSVVNTADGTSHNYGPVDKSEQYLSYIAIDSQGFIYCGIGTAKANVVVLDPQTGTITQLMPEEIRDLGTGLVLEGPDGYVYASYKNFRVKCLGGKIVQENISCPRAKPNRTVKYGSKKMDFPDGARVVRYDLNNRQVIWQDRNGDRTTYTVEYVSGGLDLTSMAAGPDNQVYYSAAHPQHLGRISPATGQLTDLGHNPAISGGNFCNMMAAYGKLYGCEYGGGRLWEYDPEKPTRYPKGFVEGFGIPHAKLLAASSAVGGRWTELTRQELLLGVGEHIDNTFTLSPVVLHAGQWYCHLQFYKSKVYGTVTMEIGGERHQFNLQSAISAPGEHLVFGPFQREAGPFPIRFSITAGQNAKQMLFSLIGLELTEIQPSLPQNQGLADLNPRQLGQWPDLVTRPRSVVRHPQTGEIIISGFANYGLTGGGFGIHDPATGKNREISDWREGESCICMDFLPDGQLIGGTSILAPGGGHLKVEQPSVFRMDWKTGKVNGAIPVPKTKEVIAITYWQGKVYAATSMQRLLVIDPIAWSVDETIDLSDGGNVPRNALLKTPDGTRLFLLQNNLISEITPKGLQVITPTNHTISAGGAIVNNTIFYCHSTCRLGYVEL